MRRAGPSGAARQPWRSSEGPLPTPLLEAGDGFWMQDPLGGAVRFRHALPDAQSTQNYLSQYHPGLPAMLVVHDIATDERTLVPIPPSPSTP